MPSALALVAPGTVAAAGLALSASQLDATFHAWRTRSWPKCPGRIQRSKVVPTGISIDRGRGSFAAYIASITYSYSVHGKTHTGTLINYRGYLPNLTRVERIVARYPHGAQVTVSYDPANPDQAVLEPGPGIGNWIGVLIGLLFLGGGIVWLVNFWGAA